MAGPEGTKANGQAGPPTSLSPAPSPASPISLLWSEAGVFTLALPLALFLAWDVNLERTVSPRFKGFIKRYVIHLDLAFLLRDSDALAPKGSWRNLSLTQISGAEDPQTLCYVKEEGI